MSLPLFHPQGTAGNSEVGGGSNRMEEGAAMDRLELIFKEKGRGADYKVLGTLPALRNHTRLPLDAYPCPPPARGCGLQAQPQSGCGGNSTSSHGSSGWIPLKLVSFLTPSRKMLF